MFFEVLGVWLDVRGGTERAGAKREGGVDYDVAMRWRGSRHRTVGVAATWGVLNGFWGAGGCAAGVARRSGANGAGDGPGERMASMMTWQG